MGSPPNAGALGLAELRSALGSSDPAIRAAALDQARPGPGVEPVVIGSLHDDEPEVRLAAVRALTRLRGPRGIRAIMQAAASDLSPAVRAEALAALTRILETRAPRSSDGED